MRTMDIKVLRGPNYWSNERKKLIVIKLDIGEFEYRPTNEIPEFSEKIRMVMPSLHFHRCSYNEVGGFFRRVEEGTWAGHVIEHIALELQCLAGISTGFGRTRSSKDKGIYFVVYSYKDEEAGKFAGEAAIDLFKRIASKKFDLISLNKKINFYTEELKRIIRKNKLGPSTSSIVKEAERRKIPVTRLNNDSLIQLGYGIKQKRIDATITSLSNFISVDLVSNKEATKKLLRLFSVPVPQGSVVNTIKEMKNAIELIKYPIVVKPLDANWGKGVMTNIDNIHDAVLAFNRAKKYSKNIIVEKFIEGKDYRILIINRKLSAASERIPAHVVGDGKNTITQLVEIINNDPWRGTGHENILTKIVLDDNSIELLKSKKYDFNSIPSNGETVYLKATANLSTGGTAINITGQIHPYNKFLFERVAAIIGLDICGVDVIAKSLIEPLTEDNGAIIEVNAAPGFRMHLSPSYGDKINVAKDVVDMLFPNKSDGKIPIYSITGTNGKTTTTRLIAHVLRLTGKTIGYTTTDGTYINEYMIERGDNTGPISARKILLDPFVEVAVLETARGGLLRSGLAFDHCDYGIITNVSEDHLGLGDIHNIKEMTRVKAVVANSVRKSGVVILNADDENVFHMKEEVDCRVALFSMNNNNEEVIKHTDAGGAASFIENNYVVLQDGRKKIYLTKVESVPLTYNGTAKCMIQNVLAATLALYCSGIPVFTITEGLGTFIPSDKINPGRFNLFRVNNFSLLVDYAHNPAGFKELKSFLKEFPAKLKTGSFASTGDRRDEDIRELGRLASTMFDQIILKEDFNLRGRPPGEGTGLLREGLLQSGFHGNIFLIEDEMDALDFALKNAQPNELIVFLACDIHKVLNRINSINNDEILLQKVLYQ